MQAVITTEPSMGLGSKSKLLLQESIVLTVPTLSHLIDKPNIKACTQYNDHSVPTTILEQKPTNSTAYEVIGLDISDAKIS